MCASFIKYVIKIGSIALGLFLTFSLKAQDYPQKTKVWEQGEDNISAYFVYGICLSKKGTILSFAEARITDGKDDGAHHIVMKRSTDKGITFSASTILVKSDGIKSYANPTALVDQTNGNIFLFYALNEKNESTAVFFIKSTDDGLNWSVPIQISAATAKNAQDWTFHLPGPGHGIQLKNKRLIIPIWHRKAITYPIAQRNYGVSCLYSDNGGETWQMGGNTPTGELNESQIAEQKNGDLLLIGRTINPKNKSYFAKLISKDKGLSWSKDLIYDEGLTGPPCDIGLTTMGNTILISQPADSKKRKDLTIRLSKDGGKTWTTNKLLEQGAATYSDLAVLPDKTMICIYGHGSTGHMPKTVSLARFDEKWLRK